MAQEPTELDDLSDADLDAAVSSGWGEDEPGSTEAPAATAPEPVESDEPSAPSADNLPAGDATPEPEPAAQPVPETASAPPAPVGTPFQFKAGGREHSLPYARQLPDGSVVIPPEQRQEFQRQMASAQELQANFRNLQRERERERRQWQTQRTEKDAEADAVSGLIADILRLSPEERFTYLAQMEGNFPQIQIDLEKRKIAEREKLIAERERGPQLSPEEQEEQHAEQAIGELDAEWSKIAEHPDVKLLSPAEQQEFREMWAGQVKQLVRPIRTPEEAQQFGGQIGQMIFDPSPFYKHLNYVVKLKKQAAPKAPTKAAAENARRNADLEQPRKPVVNAIPPTTRPAKPVGQPRDTKTGKFKTASDRGYRDYLMSDEDEDDAA